MNHILLVCYTLYRFIDHRSKNRCIACNCLEVFFHRNLLISICF